MEMKDFIEQFKAFALKGNVLDLAVAVVIGAAFGKIVTSLVEDLITPIIGMIIGKFDFSTLMLGSIKIGSLINNIINFVIVALALFLVIKFINRATHGHVGKLPDVKKDEDMK